MSDRLRRLFQRYRDRHLAIERRGPRLHGADGAEIGQIRRIALRDSRLVVEGEARVDQVSLDLGGRRRVATPGTQGLGSQGFRLSLPAAPSPAVLGLTLGGWSTTVPLPAFRPVPLWLAHAGLMARFCRDGARALPAVLRWFRHMDPAARARVKELLSLGPVEGEQRLDPAFFAPPPPAPLAKGPITIVLPVYQAFDLLQDCLDRLRRHTDLPWRLILIEDASPDPRIRPFLRDWAATEAEGQAELLENPQNLGFIGAVNRGLALALEQPAEAVVLLNSDALVPEGWASRLIAPILADPEVVASVTPMSNDAELVSVPAICARLDLAPGEADRIDRTAAAFAPGLGLAEAPTGVGFCMALNPRFLAREPAFDSAFGPGYGEEVDWCQKVAAWGGRHLCLPGLFVEHRGGASFGTAEKQRLLRRSGAIISARYPRFDGDVQAFLAEDPLVTPRLALALAWADARATSTGTLVPIYLAHSLGGGAEHYLAQRIAEDLSAGGGAVVLRVGGPARWQIELHSPAGVTRGTTADRALAERLLGLISARRVVYSCGVGDTDPIQLPGLLCDLARGPQHRVEVLFHDYFPISPSYTLLGADGHWHGLPRPGTTDRAHSVPRPDGSCADLADWQAAWAPLIARADAVVTFSEPSRALVAQAYPVDPARLVVQPHRLLQPVPPLPARPATVQRRPVIGVLGNIGAHKGAKVVTGLSQRLARTRSADLVLIGNLDPAFKLAKPARTHGSYDVAEISALAARYGITCWLIPSLWPETFSYATHEALATGLPVWGFDLGAQGDAIARAAAERGQGGVIPLRDGRADPDEILGRIAGATGASAS